MASILLATQTATTPGILLNSAEPRQYSFSVTPPTPSLQQPGSSASSVSSTSEASSRRLTVVDHRIRNVSPSSGRRIRFAPLPDPRKLELEDLDNSSTTSLSDDILYDEKIAKTPLASSPVNTSIDISYDSNGTSKPPPSPQKKLWSTKRLLGPLLPKYSLLNGAAGEVTNGPVTNGNSLFRSSSIDSVRSTHSSLSGFPFGRRHSTAHNSTVSLMSLGSNSEQRERERAVLLARTSPLGPTVSDSGAARPPTSNSKEAKTASRNSTPTGSLPRRSRFPRPHAMLNGRVYGRNRGALTPDPFQNQRAGPDVDFVEWGFGGMGSVPHTKASTTSVDYSKVQKGRSFVSAPDEEDDGSGMGWVKRRREQKEKERMEKEDREKAEAEAAANQAESDASVATAVAGDKSFAADNPEEAPADDTSTLADSKLHGGADGQDDSTLRTTSPPPHHYEVAPPLTSHYNSSVSTRTISADLTRSSSERTAAQIEHHNTSVAIIPPPPHHHPHHSHHLPRPSLSDMFSEDQGRTSTATITRGPSIERPVEPSPSTSETPSGSSSSAASDEEHEDDDDDGDDAEDEDWLAAQARRTAECAGVEKISRHRNNNNNTD